MAMIRRLVACRTEFEFLPHHRVKAQSIQAPRMRELTPATALPMLMANACQPPIWSGPRGGIQPRAAFNRYMPDLEARVPGNV